MRILEILDSAMMVYFVLFGYFNYWNAMKNPNKHSSEHDCIMAMLCFIAAMALLRR